jgi:hypothetical protein
VIDEKKVAEKLMKRKSLKRQFGTKHLIRLKHRLRMEPQLPLA